MKVWAILGALAGAAIITAIIYSTSRKGVKRCVR